MEAQPFGHLSPEVKRRTAAIEGREDLFATKVLRIPSSETVARNDLLVATRDPGSANALIPVVKELASDPSLEIDFMTDGRAQEMIQRTFETEDMTPTGAVLTAIEAIPTPRVILMDRSISELGIDTYTIANFPETPKVFVEDAYGAMRLFLQELQQRGLPFPEKICVMDSYAKQIIVDAFPDFANRVEVTGHPGFDRLAKEKTADIERDVKSKLGLRLEDKLVSYMSTIDEPEKITQLAESLRDIADNFYLAFRRHPRDNTAYATYRKILTDRGIRVVDTEACSTDEIGAASDVIITTWSVEGLYGIYRRKPTIHFVDPAFETGGRDLPLPPVRLGASVGIEKAGEFTTILPQLLNPQSDLNQSLKHGMEEHYRADGKNAERVASIVRSYFL